MYERIKNLVCFSKKFEKIILVLKMTKWVNDTFLQILYTWEGDYEVLRVPGYLASVPIGYPDAKIMDPFQP